MQPPRQTATGTTGHTLARLLRQIADGDKSAFAQLYGLTSRKLYAVAARIVRDPVTAEDIVQETYLKIWRSAASFDATMASPVTWMASVARHCAIDAIRKTRLETTVPYEDSMEVAADEPDPADEIDLAQRRAMAFAALKRLSPEKRRLILQAYFCEQSRESLARQLGVPTSTLKTHLRRSLLKLREAMPMADERKASRDVRIAKAAA